LAAEWDINPFIALALAVKKRGHHPTIITRGVYKKLITESGLFYIASSKWAPIRIRSAKSLQYFSK
jgi:hypothetical protein